MADPPLAFRRLIPEPLMLLLAAVLFTRAVSVWCFYLYDDAFITFRYALNLAEGHGFVYNIGERVQGISAPLWGLLLAGLHVLGINIEWASRAVAIAFEVVVAWLLALELRREGRPVAAILAVFLFALDPYLAKTSVGGMESSLFLMATVASMLLLLHGRETSAACVAAASCFVRPEGLLFCAGLLIYRWVESGSFPLKPFVAGATIVAAGLTLQYAYFGDFIPQSVRGKMALTRSLESVWGLILFPNRNPLQVLLTVTTLAGIVPAWRSSRFVRAFGWWALTLTAAWAIAGAHLWMWYCVPVWFFKVLVTAVAGNVWLEKTRTLERARRSITPVVLSGVVVLSWTALALVVGRDRMETNVYSRIRAWARSVDLNNQSAYAMDFGAFGYYTGLRILDEPGLVWPPGLSKYRCDMKRILLEERPEWAFVTNYQGNVAVMQSPEVAADYGPVWRASVQGDTALFRDASRVPRAWRSDFTLYRRVQP